MPVILSAYAPLDIEEDFVVTLPLVTRSLQALMFSPPVHIGAQVWT
jgi:hypothetical protein